MVEDGMNGSDPARHPRPLGASSMNIHPPSRGSDKIVPAAAPLPAGNWRKRAGSYAGTGEGAYFLSFPAASVGVSGRVARRRKRIAKQVSQVVLNQSVSFPHEPSGPWALR